MLPKLVNHDQVGYIKERYIGENIRIIEDIMTYTDLKHLPGYIILIDFEKAFDSVEWSFLLKSLASFNFGLNFMKWIKIIYTNIESCVTNNGYLSKYFQLSRALIFTLVAEVMAIKIRNDKSITGIKAESREYKICQLADDTTVFVSNSQSVTQLVLVLQKFQKYSGLKINIDKTEIIPIDTNKYKSIFLSSSINKIKINRDKFKTLEYGFHMIKKRYFK